MPLEKLYSNVKKSINATWSQDRIDDLRLQLIRILLRTPSLSTDRKVVEIRRIFDRQQTRIDFEELPLEYPFVMTTKTININIQAPNYYNSQQNFASWLKVVNRYFGITDTATDKKAELFLYFLGEENAQKLENFYSPADPAKTVSTLSYDELVAESKKLWEAIGARQSANDFFSHQQGSEPIQVFAERLQQLANLAGFKNNESVLIDKFISGIRNKRIRLELLKTETTAHFDTVLKDAKLLEQLYVDSEDQVNKINQKGHFKKKNNQKFGNKNQKPNNNPNKQPTNQQSNKPNPNRIGKDQCSYCKKSGHWKKDCFKLQNRKDRANDINLGNHLGQLNLNV